MLEDAVMPLYGTDEIIYDEEIELADYDQINLEKAKINVHERQVIRAQMEQLGAEQNEVERELNTLRTLSISLRASKGSVLSIVVCCQMWDTWHFWINTINSAHWQSGGGGTQQQQQQQSTIKHRQTPMSNGRVERSCTTITWRRFHGYVTYVGHLHLINLSSLLVYDNSTTHDLKSTTDTITLSELRRIQYFHENYVSH